MLFDKFLQLLPLIEQQPLLSSQAHLEMASKDRMKYLQDYDYTLKNPKKSAVLSLFYPKNFQTYVLLIVRSEYNGVHSAQISFPGGKMDQIDSDLKETALRETFEEVGISENKISITKQWSEIYIPPSNFLVSPFMGISKDNLEFNIDQREVNRVLELPVSDLLDNRLISKVNLNTSYADNVEVPAFIVDEFIVWGATAMILNEIKQIIKNVL